MYWSGIFWTTFFSMQKNVYKSKKYYGFQAIVEGQFGLILDNKSSLENK